MIKLGIKDYRSTLDLQKRLWEMRVNNNLPDSLILVEHTHTITSGKSARPGDILASPEEINLSGVAIYEVERGGEYTYHGPGQLVGYPILRLDGTRRIINTFIEQLEEVLIRVMRQFTIEGERRIGYPGVWVGPHKIASIGIAIRRWVTFHGFALNVNPDLSFFRLIRPCGQSWEVMTSMARILSREIDMEEVCQTVTHCFSEVFKVRIVEKNYGDIT